MGGGGAGRCGTILAIGGGGAGRCGAILAIGGGGAGRGDQASVGEGSLVGCIACVL
mgnify:FL=1